MTTALTLTITEALAAAGSAGTGDFAAGATELLAALGYRSALTLAGQSGDVGELFRRLPAPANPGTQSELDFLEAAQSVQILFQLTDAEIAASAGQPGLLDNAGGGFDTGIAQSFLFVAVALAGGAYSRSQYAAFTREINKRIQVPTVVLFRTAGQSAGQSDEGGRITLAFVHRRPNRYDPDRDVLGRVSLVREIDAADPHRAHLDILRQLALPARLVWMGLQGKSRNFDGLLDAWLDALDTEELNRRFYDELLAWFERAIDVTRFPTDEKVNLPPELHIIRLITRLLFVWFLKEKGLVAGELFIEHQAAQLLKDYDREGGDSYYRAILQNLFFATLNTPIEQRGFSSGRRRTNRLFSYYRYAKQLADADGLVDLLARTPFVNGGLFDCLDTERGAREGGYRVDCFSDVHYGKLSIPNHLFFGGAAAWRDGKPGLIDLLERYMFTVEENTPVEQEVALDPELLGKVFENLLAAVNPETSVTVRKETGSYYTPRPVVDYMVDEALVGALASGDNAESIRRLLDYADAGAAAGGPFDDAERERIVHAIADLRVIDPAVGSGAFPMGVLHKLTLALRRLDPHNYIWAEVQREQARARADAAFDTDDPDARNAELQEISAIFERYRDSDYGRKLYLIQNCIYGVDIQPIAVQIAKLRFFISLAIEQESDADAAAANYGIRPLPNLETRLVAADTLLPLERPAQLSLGQTDDINDLERAIAANRERHFHAVTRSAKQECRDRDDDLRGQLAAKLVAAGFPAASADQIAAWDPFDQNAGAAQWFDAEYMFGVGNGFDIAIANPPYVRSEGSREKQQMRKRIADSQQYETLHEKWDLYIPFMERGYQLLAPRGFTTMIVSDAYCHARYAKKSREWFLENSRIVRLDFLGKLQIFEAGVHNIVYLLQKADGQQTKPERRFHYPEFGSVEMLATDEQRNLTDRVFFPSDPAVSTISAATIPLQNICYISYGLRPSSHPNSDDKFVTADLTSTFQDDVHLKPFVDGKHLGVWLPKTNLWIEWGTDRSPVQFYAPTFHALHDVGQKILAQKNCGDEPKVCYDDGQLIFSASVIGILSWDSLSGIRNNSIRKQARYRNEKQHANLPARETLEQTSKRFSLQFLLGVLNSTFVADFLKANRRNNVSFYPDDWKRIPIPDVPKAKQRPIIRLVERILTAKAADPLADTGSVEAEIDGLVNGLYGLTAEEVAVVAGE